MPEDGLITGVIYLNYTDEISEIIDILILRPARRGWKIVHRIELPADDHPPSTRGISTLQLDSALPLNKGDIFAHWQPEARPTGPIPMNLDRVSIDGLTVGEFGFDTAEVQAGEFIKDDGFTGQRDYRINIIFMPIRQRNYVTTAEFGPDRPMIIDFSG